MPVELFARRLVEMTKRGLGQLQALLESLLVTYLPSYLTCYSQRLFTTLELLTPLGYSEANCAGSSCPRPSPSQRRLGWSRAISCQDTAKISSEETTLRRPVLKVPVWSSSIQPCQLYSQGFPHDSIEKWLPSPQQRSLLSAKFIINDIVSDTKAARAESHCPITRDYLGS
jgi:hypothetical protein